MFRDGAYKVFTQAWSDATPESTGRVILKAEGAELFLKPQLPGEIPYVTSGSQDDDSSSESEGGVIASAPATPVKGSASSPAIATSTTVARRGSLDRADPVRILVFFFFFLSD